jgi:hypothetical protein
MLILELIILAITCAATLFGIWSDPKAKKRVAGIATAIAVAGVVAAAALSVWKSSEDKRNAVAAERKRQTDVRSILATAPLTDLEVIWILEHAPDCVREDVLKISEMIVDSRLLSDDERSRLPQETQERARAAWRLESGLMPLLACIVQDRDTLNGLYKGEDFQTAKKRYEGDSNAWIEGIGTDLNYVGPAFDVVFPLNMKSTCLLSLGDRSYDVAIKESNAFEQDDPNLFRDINYQFTAVVEASGQGFRIRWVYGPSSLARAVQPPSTRITAGFPDRFTFLVVNKDRAQAAYLASAEKLFATSTETPNKPVDRKWNSRSILQIIVNGLTDRKYTYDVIKVGDYDFDSDRGAYDGPERIFSYTRFDCILRTID